jgi:hypothetical protein
VETYKTIKVIVRVHCKKFLLNSWIFFDQTFLGLRKIYAEQGIMPDFWSHLKKRFFLS